MIPGIHKFSGAGNDFVVLDGCGGGVDAFRDAGEIGRLCREYRTDGLMILGPAGEGTDFTMEFYNPDGSSGMMCGNGGRCIAAFADYLGIVPKEAGEYRFTAADGIHTAGILSREASGKWTVKLGMTDVYEVMKTPFGLFLNTGTRHLVVFVPDVDKVDVETDGRELRWKEEFAPVGTNVNFVSVHPESLHVRTFEKGVEGETLACGTGITASAIAAYIRGVPGAEEDGVFSYDIVARRGDRLSVSFRPGMADQVGHDGAGGHDGRPVIPGLTGNPLFTDLFLTGSAELIR